MYIYIDICTIQNGITQLEQKQVKARLVNKTEPEFIRQHDQAVVQ